jgi:gas vesicle protein
MHNQQPTSSNDQGSFLTGFGLGLLAGAAGYFLFATDRGKKVQSELTKEWQAAKQNLGESPASEAAAGLNLKQMLIQTASSFLELDVVKEATKTNKTSAPAKKSKTAKAAKASKSSQKKFSGV